ncbi:SagB/ThcOx family dehydrogenase [Haloplasma contractile]|uniref:NADH-flavin oxidoreductase protein n=1 Tax=Haloplasma contractile SSD-17B TaxID=1033810 RepID=U2FGS8_9MOLU|nr:SagB/ThcOx family dehydrogenase [Haloplasma contractile]ERJ12055.1 NADH-flavin oxidoreductase protein [Haloplasma contractile SSD-17B]
MSKKIGTEFMKFTQYKYLDESDQSKGTPQPPCELPYDQNQDMIELPKPGTLNSRKVNLQQLIEDRQSLRKYSDKPLTLTELSYLLWNTQGVKKRITKDKPTGKVDVTFRTVPSAGARHPFETFLLINNVEGLNKGLYRYIATEHTLIEVNMDHHIADQITDACLSQRFIIESAVTFIWMADIDRTVWRYGERSYRYAHLDAGHVCQNLYLSAEMLDAGVCAIAAYDDDALNKLLGFNGENQFVIYIGTVGKK